MEPAVLTNCDKYRKLPLKAASGTNTQGENFFYVLFDDKEMSRLTWDGPEVCKIKHDDKNTRPGNNESQNQDPGQWGAEGGVQVVCERFVWPSRRRRCRISVLGVNDHGGGRGASWGAKMDKSSQRRI